MLYSAVLAEVQPNWNATLKCMSFVFRHRGKPHVSENVSFFVVCTSKLSLSSFFWKMHNNFSFCWTRFVTGEWIFGYLHEIVFSNNTRIIALRLLSWWLLGSTLRFNWKNYSLSHNLLLFAVFANLINNLLTDLQSRFKRNRQRSSAIFLHCF